MSTLRKILVHTGCVIWALPRRSFAFSPAPPPGTHGTPVFPDLDLSTPTSDAQRRKNDPDAVMVVTGASRGIGFQFVKALSERSQGRIVACCRAPDQASELQTLSASAPGRIVGVQLDLEDQASVERAGTEIREAYDRVDLLLNVAGLLGDGKNDPGPERSLTKIDRHWFEKTLAINLVGPVMFTKELAPLLMQRRGRTKNDESVGRPPAIVANLSARVGSISDNGLGGWYSYRMSKTALNQATRTMALELKRSSAYAISLHPGTTNTDLSKPFQANVAEGKLFPVEFTVEQLLKAIDATTESHSGGFYDWVGQSLSF